MDYQKNSTTPALTKRPIAGMSDADRRLERAMATLKHTGTTSPNAWTRTLCRSKFTEAAARAKLATCGYRVRYDRADPRSVW